MWFVYNVPPDAPNLFVCGLDVSTNDGCVEHSGRAPGPAVQFAAILWFVWMVDAVYTDDGVCRPDWETYAPCILLVADTSVSLICLFLFVKPFLGKSGEYLRNNPATKSVIARNLFACLLVLSTSFTTLLAAAIDPTTAELGIFRAATFIGPWVAFDKFTDIIAVNIAFNDFSGSNMGPKQHKVYVEPPSPSSHTCAA